MMAVLHFRIVSAIGGMVPWSSARSGGLVLDDGLDLIGTLSASRTNPLVDKSSPMSGQ
jgi:hypothetical protein